MEDFEIVELFFERNEDAIKESQKKYGRYCYTIAHNILHNEQDCQEIINDTNLAAWNSIPPHRPLMLSTYLGKITRRLSLNKWRNDKTLKRGGTNVTISFEELQDCIVDENFKAKIQNKLITQSIDSFLETLKAEQRKIFVCRYWYFESIEEISQRFNCSQSKIKMMLKRTRDNLKQHLIKEGFYEEK